MPSPEWYEENGYGWVRTTVIYIVIALFIFLMIGKVLRSEASMRCDAENGNFDNGTWECVVDE